MVRLTLLLAAGLAILVVFTMRIVPRFCACDSPAPVCEEYQDADYIFRGTVTDIRVGLYSRIMARWIESSAYVDMVIDETFAGDERKSVTLSSRFGAGTHCPSSFVVGGSFLVYASKNVDGRSGKTEFHVAPCSRTRRTVDAVEDLAFLRGPKSGERGAIIYGFGSSSESNPLEPPFPLRPVVNGIVTITNGFQTWQSATDENGRYRISGLSAGDYELRMAIDGQSARDVPRLVKLREKGCAFEYFIVDGTAVISGKVVGMGDRPVRNQKIQLSYFSNPTDNCDWTTTDGDGKFRFARVVPGEYVLGVNLCTPPSVPRGENQVATPYKRTFFSGAADVNRAQALNVMFDQSITLPVWRLPEPLERRVIHGSVKGSKGPAFKELVILRDPQYEIWVDQTFTDEHGNFSLLGYKNVKYFVQVHEDLRGTIEVPVPESDNSVLTLLID